MPANDTFISQMSDNVATVTLMGVETDRGPRAVRGEKHPRWFLEADERADH